MKKKYLIAILIGVLIGSSIQFLNMYQKTNGELIKPLTNSEEKMLALYKKYTVGKLSRKELLENIEKPEFKVIIQSVVEEEIKDKDAKQYVEEHYLSLYTNINEMLEKNQLSGFKSTSVYTKGIEAILVYRLIATYVAYQEHLFSSIEETYKHTLFSNRQSNIQINKSKTFNTKKYVYTEKRLPMFTNKEISKLLGSELPPFSISSDYLIEDYCINSRSTCLEISEIKGALFDETSLIRYFE